MSLKLIRSLNQDIRDFLHRATAGGEATALITGDSLRAFSDRLREVGDLFAAPFAAETGESDQPDLSDYERNLVDLKALLERAQVDLAARREQLQAQLGKLHSASAWAETLEQTQ